MFFVWVGQKNFLRIFFRVFLIRNLKMAAPTNPLIFYNITVCDKENPPPEEEVNFSKLPEKLAGPTSEVDSVLDAWNLFFSLAILQHILQKTNERRLKRIEERKKKIRSPQEKRGRGAPKLNDTPSNPEPSYCKEITADDLKTFLSVFFAMGLAPQPSVADYWKEDNPLRSTYFSQQMGKNRWLEIFWYFFFRLQQ